MLAGRWILSSRRYYDQKSTVTKKSEEESLKRDSWIPTSGHQASLKSINQLHFAMLYLGVVQGSSVTTFSFYK